MKYKDKSTLTNISINEIDGVKFSLERERASFTTFYNST
jgi:hypothetical protein